MKKFKFLLTIILLIGILSIKTFSQSMITLVTEIPLGQKISLLISTEQGTAPTITGASGSYVNGQFSDYTVEDETIKIEGNVTILGCGDSQITSLTLSNTNKLKVLGCKRNKIESLNLAETPKLEQISCSGNLLQELDFSATPNISKIYCYSNKIKGENMTNLVNSIPLNTNPIDYEFFVVDKTNPAEENLATPADVKIAKDKNWVVYDYNGGDYTNYDGEESSGIESADGTVMNLYPSVVSDMLTVEVPNNMVSSKITIVSIDGREVYSAKITSEQTIIPLSNFADGTYLVKVGNCVKKIIKEGI